MRLLVYKTLYLCLAALLLFSAVMTGTLAWQDISQHKTNEFRGAGDVTLPDRGSVVLHKYEKAAVVENPDGENQGEDENGGGAPTPPAPLRGVRFALIRRNADGSETQMGYYLTGNDGAIQVDGLEPGDYYFLELRPPFGYDYDLDDNGEPVRRYPFTIRAGSQEAVQVTAYNRRRTGQVHITKTVENLSGEALSEEQREIAFTFTVTFSDGGAYTYMVDGGEEKVISSGGTILLRHG
ncbi:MAG: hypothetical protein LBQ33_01085, partial [Oscillospiraceae bacterium]|nr:hypothetical protein [Oscillospiraceae bacterium]